MLNAPSTNPEVEIRGGDQELRRLPQRQQLRDALDGLQPKILGLLENDRQSLHLDVPNNSSRLILQKSLIKS